MALPFLFAVGQESPRLNATASRAVRGRSTAVPRRLSCPDAPLPRADAWCLALIPKGQRANPAPHVWLLSKS